MWTRISLFAIVIVSSRNCWERGTASKKRFQIVICIRHKGCSCVDWCTCIHVTFSGGECKDIGNYMINNLGRFWRELEAWSRSNQEKQVTNIVMWAEKRRVTWILVSLLLDNISPSRKNSISKHFVRELTRLLWLHDLFYIFRSCLHRIELVESHLWDDQNLIFYGVGWYVRHIRKQWRDWPPGFRLEKGIVTFGRK